MEQKPDEGLNTRLANQCINDLEKSIGQFFITNQTNDLEKILRTIQCYKKEFAYRNFGDIPNYMKNYKSPYLVIPGQYCDPVMLYYSELGMD